MLEKPFFRSFFAQIWAFSKALLYLERVKPLEEKKNFVFKKNFFSENFFFVRPWSKAVLRAIRFTWLGYT